MYLLEERALPIIRLNEIFTIPAIQNDNLHLILVNQGDKQYALVVDDIIRQQELR